MRIKSITDKKRLSELQSFYKSFLEEPNITKYSKAFKNYAQSCPVELLNLQDPESQLIIAKPYVKNLSKDLLVEMRCFNYQLTMQKKIIWKIENGATYFNFNTQTVINNLDVNGSLETSNQKIF